MFTFLSVLAVCCTIVFVVRKNPGFCITIDNTNPNVTSNFSDMLTEPTGATSDDNEKEEEEEEEEDVLANMLGEVRELFTGGDNDE